MERGFRVAGMVQQSRVDLKEKVAGDLHLVRARRRIQTDEDICCNIGVGEPCSGYCLSQTGGQIGALIIRRDE